jgi:hypothetical protein
MPDEPGYTAARREATELILQGNLAPASLLNFWLIFYFSSPKAPPATLSQQWKSYKVGTAQFA